MLRKDALTTDLPTTARRTRSDWRALTAYVLIAGWLLSRLLVDPAGTYLSQGVQDQQAFEWYFGATAHNLVTLSNPLFSTLQNHPAGVNMLANATVMGLSIPLAPVTLTLGPHWTFLLSEWIGFAGTAFGWYWLFVRRLRVHRAAAFLGGLMVGFSPAMVSHGNGHPNFLGQFLVPVIIDRLIDLQTPKSRRATVRAGAVLGLLVTWQLWMGEEVLLLASIGIAIVGVLMLAQGQVALRAMLPGTLIGVAVTVVLFAGPLWWQFAGPQSYTSMWQPIANNDLAALWGRATRTIGADPWAAAALSMNRTEENAFFGIPIWPLLGALVVLLRHRAIARAAAGLVLVGVWLSLGTEVTLHGAPTPIPAIWPLVSHLPLFESLIATRFGLIVTPGMAILLALGIDGAIRRASAVARGQRVGKDSGASVPPWAPVAFVGTAVAVALAPMVPTRLWADPRPPVPAFFTDGLWRQQVTGGAVLAVPPPDIVDLRVADWQAAAGWGFPFNEGYFMGPDGSGTGMGARGALRLPFSMWLADVQKEGVARVASPAQRQQFLSDLGTWRTDLVVLPARPDDALLRQSVESVLGPGSTAGGVTYWDVRGLRRG